MAYLVKIDEATFQKWLTGFIVDYAQDHINNSRWSVENAEQLSEKEIRQIIPEGLATKDQYLYRIVAGETGQDVGMLWFGIRQRPSGKRSAFVYNIKIDEAFRRRGYAIGAFRELETIVQDLGFTEIGLHTFGFNHAARAMYEKLGYEITNLEMAKKLTILDAE